MDDVTPHEAAGILRFWHEADIGADGLFWKVGSDGDSRPVSLFAICSDTFAWATADAEEIMPADLPLLEKCAADLGYLNSGWLPYLYAARKRGMRPMRAFYRDMGDDSRADLRPLFDACGPERDPASEG